MHCRTTIDFGIHMGLSHAAIAVIDDGSVHVIKNNHDEDRTPCAVYVNRHSQIHAGRPAKNRLDDERSMEDVYVEFRRRMGTDHKYLFKSSGKVMTPEELTAEMLRSVRGDVNQRLGEFIRGAVLTVPVTFEQKQCTAMRTAGELAGLYQCPLVQEPVAAALAYGYQSDVTKEYWLIFDFGGGTFDAAIMKAEDGTIAVVNHGGDNYLGGSDMDWAIVEQLIIPEIEGEFNLPDFKRGNKQWRTALAVIKRAVEVAKINLSRSDTTYLEDCRIKDADGAEIEIEYKLTRDALVSVAEPLIMRAVDISKRVLKEKNLTPNAIEKVVLVGGPTLAPYFREILQSRLGIALHFSVDPLTVVARGAAVFAGTQRIEGNAAPKAAAGQFDLDVKYKPVGADEDPTVRGAVKAQEGQSVDGFTIEFVNQQTQWRSGKVPIKDNGRFRVDLRAEKGERNNFTIELLDATGTRRVCVPDSISYTIGRAISEQPIINSISVALANNEADVFFRKGDPLPAKATRIYQLSRAVQKGSEDHVVHLLLVEGESKRADRNRLLGTLIVSGMQIRGDVPAGSEVEVTIHMDAARVIRAMAYIPVLDEEYEAVMDYNTANPDLARLQKEYESEIGRMDGLREKACDANDSDAEDILDEIEESDAVETIKRLLNAASVDPDAANDAEKRLLEMKMVLDEVDTSMTWKVLVDKTRRALGALEALVFQRIRADCKLLEKTRQDIAELVTQRRVESLQRKMDEIANLCREMKDGAGAPTREQKGTLQHGDT
jgi:molecular chaperone DnaK